MRRMILGSALLMVAVLVGCTNEVPEKEKEGSAAPTVTATRTATETKAPPPPEPQRTVAPPENPTPEGPATDCTYTDSRPAIKLGSNGAAVQQAQCYLNLSSAEEDIPEDGNFGPVTEDAAKRFQSCAGITVDGVIGSETWPYLVHWAGALTYLC